MRVSQILAPVPSTSVTKRRVRVAIPLMREIRLSMVRSRRTMARALPSRRARVVPGLTGDPSSSSSWHPIRPGGVKTPIRSGMNASPAAIPSSLERRRTPRDRKSVV